MINKRKKLIGLVAGFLIIVLAIFAIYLLQPEKNAEYYAKDDNYLELEDEQGFCIFDGVLYAYVGDATEITVPEDVKEIFSDAFSWDCDHGTELVKVTIPGTVEAIDARAFAFTNADYIYIEEGVKKLGESLFMDSYIKEVHFPSTITNAEPLILETEEGLDGTKIYVVKDSMMENYFKDDMPYGDAELIVE